MSGTSIECDYVACIILNELGARRQGLVNQHSTEHPARVLFETIENIPKGSLICLALSHGLDIKVGDRILTSEALRVKIYARVGTGQCKHREGQVSHLGCSSIEAQLDPSTSDFKQDDPSKRMQIQILKQLAPVLKTRPLRRLLELHDVSYTESDKLKKLRKRLKSFLYSLASGKPMSGESVEIFPKTLSFIVYGSCAEHLPDSEYTTLCLNDFDLDLLSRPRYTPCDESAGLAGEGSADNETDDGSDGSYDPMEVDEDLKSRPWLDGRRPEPPMPRDM
ncbi:hypothetical protein B0H13DRAFT_1898325 [Mycena leptocephala]|nr:hypothetical protein B0H13DRAFT_1898325 [Mycena leptocephala]